MSRSSTDAAVSAGPKPADLPRSMGWALGSGTILMGLNSAIIAVALIPIATFYGDRDGIPWLVSGLYIAAAVGSPLGGRLGDLFGSRRVYLLGLGLILVASIAGPFLPSVGWLIADRVVLGIGSALQFPSAMAILRQQAGRRGQSPVNAIGIVALCGQTTAALGPTVGGIVTLFFGWQGIFWVNLPMVLNSALWVWLTVPVDPAPTRPRSARDLLGRIDPVGIVLFLGGMVLLMLGLLSLETAPRWWELAAVLPFAAALILWERRQPSPFLDVRLMARVPQVALTCLRGIATFVSFYCIFYGLPQWLEDSRRLDPGTAGLLIFPTFGVGALSTILATRLGKRLQPRLLLIIGNTAMMVAGALMAFTVGTDAPIWLLIVVGALMGVPNGFNNLGNQLMLHHHAPESHAGAATGLYRTSQYVGAMIAAVICAAALGQDRPAGGMTALGLVVGGIGAALFLVNGGQLLRARRAPLATEGRA